jgi:hypothetical protein
VYLHFFDGPTRCVDAIELAWRFAMGEPPAGEDLREVDDACEAQIDELYDSDDTGYPMYSLKSMIGALHSVTDATTNAALDAAFCAQDAALCADFENKDAAELEEANWQLRALDTAASSDAVGREMFAHLRASPGWLQEFRRIRRLAP